MDWWWACSHQLPVTLRSPPPRLHIHRSPRGGELEVFREPCPGHAALSKGGIPDSFPGKNALAAPNPWLPRCRPSAVRGFVPASRVGKKSVREIKELDNEIGDVTKGLVCRGWFAERGGCPQWGSSPSVRGQPSPEHPSCLPAGTADLPFPGCGGAAGGSSLHWTPAVCFLLPSTSHVHDHHGEW